MCKRSRLDCSGSAAPAVVSLPIHCLHPVSRAGDILLLFLLVPPAAIMALTEAVCTPRSPFHINNIRYNRLLPEEPTAAAQAVKMKPSACSSVTLKFLSSCPIFCLPSSPPWQRKAALWHRQR